jgi:predicted amidohydrolase YtcJ
MLREIQLVLLLMGAFKLPAAAAGCDDMADTSLLHGNVLTVDQNDGIAQAIAIRRNRIVAVGSDPRACGGPLIERESALGIARAQALRMYTLNSAWLVRDDDKRGSIEAGKVADLAVLDADLMRVPVDQIGKIRSVLTIMDGRTVHAETPYAHVPWTR